MSDFIILVEGTKKNPTNKNNLPLLCTLLIFTWTLPLNQQMHPVGQWVIFSSMADSVDNY